MVIYPAIDLFDGKAVRLFKGDYARMTVYNENPVAVAMDFKAKGATHIHLVDLEGAKSGTTPNLETVCAIKKATGLFCEIGGGVRIQRIPEHDFLNLFADINDVSVVVRIAGINKRLMILPVFPRNCRRCRGRKEHCCQQKSGYFSENPVHKTDSFISK